MSDDGEDNIDIFQEPAGYLPPPKPSTVQTHRLRNGDEITLRLVGSDPLWGHLLWNAGRTVADYLEDHLQRLVLGRVVLELGAGAGLPSLVCALRGAKYVLVTDYPDAQLVDNLNHNVEHCLGLLQAFKARPSVLLLEAKGHRWGDSVDPELVQNIPPVASTHGADEKRFTLLILADLLFNHSEHERLLKTMRSTLARTTEAVALVFFTPYRPWLLQDDLNFLTLAERGDESGNGAFKVRKVMQKVLDKVMFPNDRGDETLRRTVFGYELTWKDTNW